MAKIDFNKIKNIHFIGIGGIGLSAIAKLMLMKGKSISGSDMSESAIINDLKKLGADIFIGQKAENLADDAELVIYTLAIPKNNPERAKAEKLKIPMLTYPEALELLFNDKFGIAICGTHGKSTTTSLVGLVLAGSRLDPSVVVGSKVPAFGGNLRLGKSENFVIEACEYERAFMEYYPKIIILNNIELDHTDYYKNIDDYRSAFEEFVKHLPENGVLICNGDDMEISTLKSRILKIRSINESDPAPRAQGIPARNGTGRAGASCDVLAPPKSFSESLSSPRQIAGYCGRHNKKLKIINFGFGEDNEIRGYDFETGAGQAKFKVKYKSEEIGEFTLKIPGKFNVYNALAALAAGLEMGVSVESIRETLAEFGGIWRRFEIKGKYKPAGASAEFWRDEGATVISDYAHHPTAVKSTIEAAREFYPGHRIVAAFQPHQHNRTKELYKDFLKSFDAADIVILAEIFDVAGREEKKDQNVSSQCLVEDIKKRNKKLAPNVFYAKNPDETRRLIDEKIKEGDTLLIMGAGDIYKIADEIVKQK